MRLRHLAMELSKLPPHPQHNVELEQYATEGDFAARWIAEMIERGDLDASTHVVDLGAGKWNPRHRMSFWSVALRHCWLKLTLIANMSTKGSNGSSVMFKIGLETMSI